MTAYLLDHSIQPLKKEKKTTDEIKDPRKLIKLLRKQVLREKNYKL